MKLRTSVIAFIFFGIMHADAKDFRITDYETLGEKRMGDTDEKFLRCRDT